MATLSLPVACTIERRPSRRAKVGGPVLVTSRGDGSSDGAIRLAFALAEQSGLVVELLAVLEPAPMIAPEFGALLDVPDQTGERRQALEIAVDAQLQRLGIAPTDVTVGVRTGDPAAVIARAARDAGASVLVLGVSHHHPADRIFGTDTAVRVARTADVPVLVVPPGYGEIPRSAVIAVDFSGASIRAARAALGLFPMLDDLYLVHVAPQVPPVIELVVRSEGQYLNRAERAFDEVRDGIPVPPHAMVVRQVVQGNPARELLRIADARGAELIVAGSHGHGALQRIFVGSVASALLRGATVPVLVLPSRAGAGIRDPHVQAMRDPQSWPRALDEFSKRNEGRRATLEMDDPELGAQAQEVDYPFCGCVYDPFDGRLAIMLGDGNPGMRHLMRGISGVAEVDILRGDDGRDRILRVAHGRRGGQTMLVFTS